MNAVTKKDLQKWYLLTTEAQLSFMNSDREGGILVPKCSVINKTKDVFFVSVDFFDGVWELTDYVQVGKKTLGTVEEALDWIHEQWELVYDKLPPEDKSRVRPEFVPTEKSAKLPPSITLNEEDLSLL
jgi:hypothetical protein